MVVLLLQFDRLEQHCHMFSLIVNIDIEPELMERVKVPMVKCVQQRQRLCHQPNEHLLLLVSRSAQMFGENEKDPWSPVTRLSPVNVIGAEQQSSEIDLIQLKLVKKLVCMSR